MKLANLAAAGKTGQFRQGFRQHYFIALPVVRRTKSPADRMVDKHCARRRQSAHDVVRRADDECRNSSTFDHVSDETDGLVAKRSVRDEQREIDLGACQFTGKRWRELVFNCLMLPQAAHEGKMKR